MAKKYFIIILLSFFAGNVLAQRNSPKLYNKIIKFDEAVNYEKIFDAEDDILAYGHNHNDTAAIEMFYILGINHLYYGDLEPANLYLEKTYNLNDSLGWISADDEFEKLYFLAASEWYLEEYKKADATFSKLFSLGKKTYEPDSDDLLGVFLEYSYFLEEQGLLEKADSVLSYAISNGKGNQYSLPSLQSNQALIANELGDYSRAKKLYYISIEGLELIKEDDPATYVSTLSNLGNLYYDLGQYPVSEQIQTKALKQFEEIGLGQSENALGVMHNLAFTSNELGRSSRALSIYKKIINIEEGSDKDELKFALTLNNLGIVYHDIGKYDTAIYYFNRALNLIISEEGVQNPNYAITLHNKAKSFLYSHRYDSAISNCKIGLGIIKNITTESNPEIAVYQHTLGLIYYSVGNYKESEFYLNKALDLRFSRLGKLNPTYAETAFELAKLMWAQQKIEAANSYFSSAFESYLNQVKVFFSTMSEYERTKFFVEKIKPSVELYYSFALENSNALILTELMYYRLQTKGLLYYSSSNVRRAILASGNPELIDNYDLWLKKRDELAKLIQNNKSTEIINNLWAEVNQLEKKVSEASTSFSSSTKPIFLSDIQRNLKDNETAIEIIRYNSYDPSNGGSNLDSINYAAIIITPKDIVKKVMLKNSNLLESKYLRYYSNATRFLRDDLRSYAKYWKPIEDQLNDSNIIYVSTDGVYNNINLNILYNPVTRKYVLDNKNVIPLTSLSDISKRTLGTISKNPSYFFGYPSYSKLPEDTSLTNSTIETKIAEAENNASFDVVSNSLYSNLISNSLFKPLPGTLIEVEQIKELYELKNTPYKSFLKESATEAALKKVEEPTVLHIATHGFFLPTISNSEGNQPAKSNPLLQSGLVLAGAEKLQKNPNLSSENGVLTAYEAMNLNLNSTQLVVMSACETGLGTISNGEGVYGLQRAFQIAGAKSVVMSMWTVNDTATQQLMKQFYTNWLNGEDKHEAFRNAQLELKKKYSKPYYWGAFIMNGL
jgi:CHAT domain-containing protein